ncbi:MAG: hypothetical protein RI990_1261 [Planctomycetota bacterium]
MVTSARRNDMIQERQRLETLERMALLYTPAEESFDRLTRLAARVMRAPIALLSVLGEDRSWFKSRYGLQVNEVAPDDGVIATVLDAPGPLVVVDALADARLARSGLVVNSPFVRFVAGTAVRAPDGAKIGALCVADTEPRVGAEGDLPFLRDLAAVAEGELHRRQLTFAQGDMIRELGEARRRSMVDPLTRVWNRAGLDAILGREIDAARSRRVPLSVAMVDLDHFKQVNDRHGHGVGDVVLTEVARRLRVAARPIDSVARFGGEEFAVVLPECGEADARAVAERLRRRIGDSPITAGTAVRIAVTCSIGVATLQGDEHGSVLMTRADIALYDAKGEGRDRVVVAPPPVRAVDRTD